MVRTYMDIHEAQKIYKEKKKERSVSKKQRNLIAAFQLKQDFLYRFNRDPVIKYEASHWLFGCGNLISWFFHSLACPVRQSGHNVIGTTMNSIQKLSVHYS